MTHTMILGLITSWEEGAKGSEGKSKMEKDKILRIKPRDASPRDPRESNKRLLSKKQEGHNKNNKTRPS